MRKLILLAAICAAGLFGSCDTSELHETSMRGVSPQFESCVVPINEALGDLQGVLAVMNGNTRSVSQNLQPVQILCKGDYSNTRVVTPNADVPMAYVVNFDEGGYAVLGADRRQSSVIVVAPCGEMSPAKLIEDKRAVDAGEKVDTRTYMNARVANYILSAPVDPQNQARIVGPPTPGDWQITEHQLPLMTTKWDQGVYYNMYCNTLDGINAPSGCVATAVAQMLVFNHWKYNKGIAKFGNYTPNWNLLDEAAAIPNIAETRNGRPVHIASAACEEETNQFIHEVGLAIGTIYTINASGASLQSIPSALSGNSYRYIKYIAPSPNPNPILKITRNMVWK
ncbi:MAG: C10 family peptidase, partial [Alistipes sp.]